MLERYAAAHRRRMDFSLASSSTVAAGSSSSTIGSSCEPLLHASGTVMASKASRETAQKAILTCSCSFFSPSVSDKNAIITGSVVAEALVKYINSLSLTR